MQHINRGKGDRKQFNLSSSIDACDLWCDVVYENLKSVSPIDSSFVISDSIIVVTQTYVVNSD
jgi:hypothetical protein